jgi:quercetin dioxygenase-like cupin family protein
MSARRLTVLVVAAGMAAGTSGCGASPERASDHPRAAAARSETLTPLVQMPLPTVKGRTFTSAIVAFPPGARAAPHRHGSAFVYAYVLEGTVASRLQGQSRHVYHAGDDWVEQPGAHHVLTKNTSRTAPAKLLVVFVSHTGDRLKVDDPRR